MALALGMLDYMKYATDIAIFCLLFLLQILFAFQQSPIRTLKVNVNKMCFICFDSKSDQNDQDQSYGP